MPGPLTIAATAQAAQTAGNILGGGFGPTEGFKQREQQRQFIRQALAQMTPEAINDFFNQLQEQQDPFLNTLVSDALQAGEADSRSLSSNMARYGLNRTGAGLGRGLVAGAVSNAKSTRAQLIQSLLDQATELRGRRANILGNAAANTYTGGPNSNVGTRQVTQFGSMLPFLIPQNSPQPTGPTQFQQGQASQYFQDNPGFFIPGFN